MYPIHITVHSVVDSLAVECDVFNRFKNIYSSHPTIKSCRVVVERLKTHQHKNHFLYSVGLDATIADREIVCMKQNQNLYAAIREVFVAVEKLLEKKTMLSFEHCDKYAFYPSMYQQSERASAVK